MKKLSFVYFLFPLIMLCISGCFPLIIGGAVGALGGYAISKDTIQGDTDKPYAGLWDAAIMLSRARGTIKEEDSRKGYIELEAESSRVWIRLIRITQSTTRVRVSARKYHFPNLGLAQDLFVRIIEQAK